MITKLGQESSYQETYWPDVLDFVPRQLGRKNLPDDLFAPGSNAYGTDIWHAYEFSWLDDQGSPESAILRIIIPATSTHIVESKSLKLYLGSFSFEKTSSVQTIVETIQRDLSKGTGATIEVQALSLDAHNLIPVVPKGYCVDLHSVKNPAFDYNPSLLRTGKDQREELLFSHSFRSLCPVTSQPDWASVFVMYKGKEIYPEELRHYLISYRRHQGFHESCCEQIFHDILTQCEPEELGVMCCFTRRGGLDINPIRSNSKTNRMQFMRMIRQ